MKRIISILFVVFIYQIGWSQNIGIGTTMPNPSAQLDIVSNNKGLLIPRTDTANIVLPVPGLMLYQSDANKFYYYDGSKWASMNDGAGLWTNTGSLTYREQDVIIGGTNKIGSGNLTVHGNTIGFGGVYANVNATSARPFYGYAVNGIAKAYHYFDDNSDAWLFFKGGTALHLNSSNNLSIGTILGQQKLHVNGGIKLGNTNTNIAGSMKWDGNDFSGYDGSSWKSFTQLDSSIWEYYPTTTLENDFVYREGNILLGDFETFPNSSTPLGFSDVAKLTIASNNGIGAFWSYIDGLGGGLQSFWSTESGISAKRLAIGVNSTSGQDAHLSLFCENLSIQLNENFHKYSADMMIFSNKFRENSNRGLQFIFDENANDVVSSRIFFRAGSTNNYGFSFKYNDSGTIDDLNIPDEAFGLISHENNSAGDIVYLIDRNTGYFGIGNILPSRHFHVDSNEGVDPFRVSVNQAVAMEVEASGQVGIGTSNPSDHLHISAPAGADALRVQINGTTRFRVHDNGSVSIGANTSGSPGGMYCDGIAEKPGGGLWSIPSDFNLKENIIDYSNGIDILKKVRPVSFNYKSET
ncbi:MAG: tail fiber domain-containing protein, partial [Bacteroidota bacterium]